MKKLNENQFKQLKKIIENLLPEEKEKLLSGINNTIERSIPKELKNLPRINHKPYEYKSSPLGKKVCIYYSITDEIVNKDTYFWIDDLIDILKMNNINVSSSKIFDNIIKKQIVFNTEKVSFDNDDYDPKSMIQDKIHLNKYCFIIKPNAFSFSKF